MLKYSMSRKLSLFIARIAAMTLSAMCACWQSVHAGTHTEPQTIQAVPDRSREYVPIELPKSTRPTAWTVHAWLDDERLLVSSGLGESGPIRQVWTWNTRTQAVDLELDGVL